MDNFNIKEFSYHISWRTRGRHPGRHTSTQRGMGMEFRGHTTLLSYPDPRRIDIRQTIRDPMEQIYVRLFNQKSSTPVFAICDLSGSMNFGSRKRKLRLAAEIVESIAQSAGHNADPFGFLGFDEVVREDWISTASAKAQRGLEMAEKLKDYHPPHIGSDGLVDIYRFLPRERSLVFLISDFHMPMSLLEQSLPMLLRHHIVPVVLWDAEEYRNIPEFGITSVADSETGVRRTLFLRKELRERIIQSFEDRRTAIYEMFMRFDMPPFFVEGEFDADDLTEYFHQFIAV
ncbi:MAG TPA: DUF58 domain-containing protein [Methylophilaceae bacterium]|nr:DUF58 domain-containing protein [Methylophilaceae bacterium]